jgi:hypothetical protein
MPGTLTVFGKATIAFVYAASAGIAVAAIGTVLLRSALLGLVTGVFASLLTAFGFGYGVRKANDGRQAFLGRHDAARVKTEATVMLAPPICESLPKGSLRERLARLEADKAASGF